MNELDPTSNLLIYRSTNDNAFLFKPLRPSYPYLLDTIYQRIRTKLLENMSFWNPFRRSDHHKEAEQAGEIKVIVKWNKDR